MRRVFIIDTSVILSGKPISFDGEMFTTPRIASEFSPGGKSYRMFQFLIEAGLKIISPHHDMIQVVEKIILKTGDQLSEADEELLALALEFRDKEDVSVTIVTDDYGIQNIADELDIKYHGIDQRGITKKFKWVWRCQGCGRIFMEKMDICPICGSELKHIPHGKKSLKKRDSNEDR